MNHQKPAYGIPEAAELLSLGRTKVYQEIDAGRLRSYKVGKRRLIAAQDIDAYVAKCRESAQEAA